MILGRFVAVVVVLIAVHQTPVLSMAFMASGEGHTCGFREKLEEESLYGVASSSHKVRTCSIIV
jgi:hypothetical protein